MPNDDIKGDNQADAGSSGHYGYHGHHHHAGGATIGSHDVVDPVCGKSIDPHMTSHYVDHDGTRLHFCSAACQSTFESEPESFLQGR